MNWDWARKQCTIFKLYAEFNVSKMKIYKCGMLEWVNPEGAIIHRKIHALDTEDPFFDFITKYNCSDKKF